jgi:hypothetical protein
MVIERTEEEVVIRLPASINTEGLQNLLDYLIYKEATVNSMATQDKVDALANEVKGGWWAKNQARLAK